MQQSHTARTPSHRVTQARHLHHGRPTFSARCSCGASVAGLPTSGMVAGWEGEHRDAERRRLPAFFDAPEPFTYEAAIARQNPTLGLLLTVGADDHRGGAR